MSEHILYRKMSGKQCVHCGTELVPYIDSLLYLEADFYMETDPNGEYIGSLCGFCYSDYKPPKRRIYPSGRFIL